MQLAKSIILIIILIALLPISTLGQESAEPRDLETGIAQIANDLVSTMKGKGIRRLAIVDFTDIRGYSSALEVFVAEELITQLVTASSGEFSIVERRQLVRILEEQKLTSSSLFDQQAIANLGKILGIDTLITGSIAEAGDLVKINARAISVESGLVFAAASARIAKKGAAESLLLQGSAPGARTGQAGSSGSERQVQAADVFFQNQDFRLTVQSLAFSKENQSVVVALNLENVTSEKLLLAMETRNDFFNLCAADLVDSKGRNFSLRRENLAGIVCVGSSTLEKGGGFAEFAPQSRSTLVFTFGLGSKEDGDKSGETFYSFGATFIKKLGTGMSRVSAGIANIRAQ